MSGEKERMAGCGQHTLTEATTAVEWDGLCPIHLEASRDALAEERNKLLDEVEALRFAAEGARKAYATLLAHNAVLEEELAARKT